MKKLKNLLGVILLAVFVFVGLWVARDNPAETSPVILGFPLVGLPLGVWLLLTFFVGIVAALIGTLPLVSRLKASNRRKEQRILAANKEIAGLKARSPFDKAS